MKSSLLAGFGVGLGTPLTLLFPLTFGRKGEGHV